jgi:uncharacterized protein YukE
VQSAEVAINNSLAGANAAIVTANTAMKAYVDAGTSSLQAYINSVGASVTAANAAIVTANTAAVSYFNSQITAVYANIGGFITSTQSNAASLANTIVNNTGNITTLQANLSTLSANFAGLYGREGNLTSNVASIYANVSNLTTETTTIMATLNAINTDIANLSVSLLTGNIFANNVTAQNTITANTIIAVDGFSWSNGAPYVTSISPTGNIVFSGDNISSADAAGGMNFFSNGKIHVESFTGFNSTNPGYWVDIGNLQNVNTGNLGINFSNAGSYATTVVSTFDWWDGIGSGQTNNSSTQHATYGLYRGDGVPGSGQTRALITFDLHAAANIAPIQVNLDSSVTMGNVIAGNLTVNSNIAYIMGNYQNWTSNVYTISSALDQLAARLKAAGH